MTTTDKRKAILILFDVDGTLTPARQNIDNKVHTYLQSLRERLYVGLVGGSDLSKIAEQMLPPELNAREVDPIEVCVNNYDYVFAENGLVAYKDGQLFAKQSLIDHLGEEKIQKFINFCLGYMSRLVLPTKRGNFIEFRNGLINVCPVGRSCSQKEREEFVTYDRENLVRQHFILELNKAFGPDSPQPLGLVFSIGGQISIDAFPKGWDKTFSLNLLNRDFDKIYFFGDKTYKGGNDYEIFSDPRTIGKTVLDPSDTLNQLANLDI